MEILVKNRFGRVVLVPKSIANTMVSKNEAEFVEEDSIQEPVVTEEVELDKETNKIAEKVVSKFKTKKNK